MSLLASLQRDVWQAHMPALDATVLASVTAGRAERRQQLLELFVEELDKDLRALRTAVTHEAWSSAAHALKNSAAGVGATRLTTLADELQELAPVDWRATRVDAEAALARLVGEARGEALRLMLARPAQR